VDVCSDLAVVLDDSVFRDGVPVFCDEVTVPPEAVLGVEVVELGVDGVSGV
jgi:hypothetical protein